MKARIKGTDAVINVQPIYSVDGLSIESFVNVTNGDLFQPRAIDIIPNDTDWDALRNQAAIAAMQGMLSNPQSYLREGDTYPKAAVRFSNELIEELKKKQSV